jgi:thiol:disulfide interchange protein DsbA
MLKRALLLIVLLLPLPALAQLRWINGKHYTTLPAGTTAENRPGKIEVAEVFSYACIHCYRSKNIVAQLQAALPADAYMSYVHASFIPAEAWPMFQRAYYTALSLGIAAPNHDRMFAAVWETRELGLPDPAAGRKNLPTLEQAARFYAKTGKVKEADFLKLARSPAIDAQVKRADAIVKAWRIPGTPGIVVNGRYLIDNDALSTWGDIRALVLFLVGQERARMARQTPQPARKP